MKKKLYLVTQMFPYDGGEKTFITPELVYLKENFDLTIIPTEKQHGEYDADVNVAPISLERNVISKFGDMIRFLCEKDAWEEFRAIIASRHDICKQIYRALMFGTAAVTFFHAFSEKTKLQNDSESIVYFYWEDYKCFGLTMYKRKFPGLHIVSRIHGYDLYDDRELYGRQFFKKQMDRGLDRLIFISEYGQKYYLDKYKKEASVKYPLHRLGIKRRGVEVKEYRNQEEHILVSCCDVIALKRVDLIIKALAKVSEKIRWVHFGDGDLMQEAQSLAKNELDLRENICYEFMGMKPNEEIIDFYLANQVEAFVTTSSTEGTPVSIQEALAYGIPIIGTAVGDIPVMVDGNGILLDKDPSVDEIADAISKLCNMELEEKRALRENAYLKYRAYYDADVQHPAMVEDLLSL